MPVRYRLARHRRGRGRRELDPCRRRLDLPAGRPAARHGWAFLAPIGAQECDHGRCTGAHQINPSGCGGPMQIAMRRSPCLARRRTRYQQDGDGDGRSDPFSLADSVDTAAVILRRAKGAGAIGGCTVAYRRAAAPTTGPARTRRSPMPTRSSAAASAAATQRQVTRPPTFGRRRRRLKSRKNGGPGAAEWPRCGEETRDRRGDAWRCGCQPRIRQGATRCPSRRKRNQPYP
jgi:hypothetical protein